MADADLIVRDADEVPWNDGQTVDESHITLKRRLTKFVVESEKLKVLIPLDNASHMPEAGEGGHNRSGHIGDRIEISAVDYQAEKT